MKTIGETIHTIDEEVAVLEDKILNGYKYDPDRADWLVRRNAFLAVRRFITEEAEPER